MKKVLTKLKRKSRKSKQNYGKLTKELSLDDLQVIVIKKEIEAGSKSINTVMKSEISNDEKSKKLKPSMKNRQNYKYFS